MATIYSQASCNAGHTELDHNLSMDLGSSDTVLDELSTFSAIPFDGCSDSQAPKSPPIGLQLRKSESFLELINEHLKHATSVTMVS